MESGISVVGSVVLRLDTLKYAQLVYGEQTVDAGPHLIAPR